MRLRRIQGVMLHAWYHLSHSMETWMDLVWFPIMQFLVFSLIAMFLAQEETHAQILLFGYVFWVVIEVGQYSISVGALWEVWSKSLSSLFISPLTLSEFVGGQMLFGALKSVVMFLVTATLANLFFGYNIFLLGPVLVIHFIMLMIFSWTAGMFVLGLILRYGTNIQSLAWGAIFLLQPLAAVFFPVEVLPEAVRWIAYLFPVTYVFEGMRQQLFMGVLPVDYLVKAALMNVLFFAGSALFLRRMNRSARKNGAIVRMEG